MKLQVNTKLGKLTLLEELEAVGNHRFWLCRCDCGKSKRVRQSNLVTGLTRSCGCGHAAQKSLDLGNATDFSAGKL